MLLPVLVVVLLIIALVARDWLLRLEPNCVVFSVRETSSDTCCIAAKSSGLCASASATSAAPLSTLIEEICCCGGERDRAGEAFCSFSTSALPVAAAVLAPVFPESFERAPAYVFHCNNKCSSFSPIDCLSMASSFNMERLLKNGDGLLGGSRMSRYRDTIKTFTNSICFYCHVQ